jgi:hypothetical protein
MDLAQMALAQMSRVDLKRSVRKSADVMGILIDVEVVDS